MLCAHLSQGEGDGISIVQAGFVCQGPMSVCSAIQIAMYELTARHFHKSLSKGDLGKAVILLSLVFNWICTLLLP